jgi:hypothetical protein
MVRHYFICTCGKKCHADSKKIREHLTSEMHDYNTFRITKEKTLKKLQKKMSKLFDNMKNMTDEEFLNKSNKYKKEFERCNINEKLENKMWYHRIENSIVYLYYRSLTEKEIEYKLQIFSNVEY